MMTEQLIQDWLQAGNAGEGASIEEERVVSNLVGCEDHILLGWEVLTAKALDSSVITFPQFIGGVTARVEQEPDLTVAGRGLSLLPRVFVAIQNEPSRNDVHAFVPYLSARLQDASPGIYYISEALSIMSKWKRFPAGDAQEVLRAIFTLGASNHFASQTATTRLSLYTLVDILRSTHTNAIKRDMSEKEVVKGIVTMAELEKNPSCLRALFDLYVLLSQEWMLDDDDYKLIFDSFIRYFPVTMKEAPKDPKIPSTSELRDLLLKCFVANDGYAKMTFDAMVERLDVDSANTKVEVFNTLTRGVQTYSVETVSGSANKLWDSLKFEVWNGENEQWIQSSLDLLSEMAKSLDRTPCEWSDKDNKVYKYLIGALAECRDRIKDKPHTYLGTSGRMFNALASASPYAFYLVSRTVVPIMDTLAQAHSGGVERTNVLEVLNGILRARLVQGDITPATAQESSAQSSPELQDYRTKSMTQMSSSFSSFRDRLVEIYHEGISQIIKSTDSSENLSHCVPAIKGLELIFKIPAYLSESEKGMIVGELVQVAFKSNQKDDVRETSLSALGSISSTDAGLFRNFILPIVLGMLPEKISIKSGEQEIELDSIVSLLDYLIQISSSSTSDVVSRFASFDLMQEKLIRKLVELLSQPGQTKYQHAILAALCAWYEATESDKGQQVSITTSLATTSEFSPVQFLLQSVVKKVQNDDGESVHVIESADETLVRFIGEYLMRSLRYDRVGKLDNPCVRWDESHSTYPSSVLTLFTSIDKQNLAGTQTNLVNAPESQWLANTLSMYLVAGSRREDLETINKKFDPAQIAVAMLRNSISPNSQSSRFSRLSVLNFLQLLINKSGAARTQLADDGHTLVDLMRKHLEEIASKGKEEALNAYQTLAYFTAASLAALDRSATVLLQCMLDGLKHPKYGKKVAQSFRLLLAPSDILTKENSCLLRPLRKGRLYQITVNPLITNWRTSQDPVLKDNSLIALTGVLAFLEPSMLSDNAKELLPVLLEGTNVQGDQFAKSACIKGILDLMSLTPSLIEEHLAAVIERMTDRTHNTYHSPSDSNVRCRAMALEVLAKLTEVVSTGVLLKRKAGLIRELDVALEDCSSEVRAKAERCKMAWFNLVDGE